MMADATEAAAKSLTDHSHDAICKLVTKIIDSQVASGLLKDAPISFRDVEIIKKTFIERLESLYRTRIKYPDKIKPMQPKAVTDEKPADDASKTDVAAENTADDASKTAAENTADASEAKQ
jgi:hypothetical protein